MCTCSIVGDLSLTYDVTGSGGDEEGAMFTLATQARDVISFGPFSLVVSERLLTRDGAEVELGARALDTLIVLLSRPNEVVGKKDLLGPSLARRHCR